MGELTQDSVSIAISLPAGDGVIVANADGVVEFANSQAHTVFGYGDGEMTGLPLVLLMPMEYRDAHLRAFKHYLKTGEGKLIGQTIPLQGLKKDGTVFSLTLTLHASEDNRFVAFIHDKSLVELGIPAWGSAGNG